MADRFPCRGLTLEARRAAAQEAGGVPEAESARQGGLGAPVQSGVRALQAEAAVQAGARRTLVLVHLAPLAAEAWERTRGTG